MAGVTQAQYWQQHAQFLERFIMSMAPQRMKVVSPPDDGMVEVQSMNPEEGDETRLYANLYGFYLEADDEVWVSFSPGVTESDDGKPKPPVGLILGIVNRPGKSRLRQEFDYPIDIRMRGADSTAAFRIRNNAGVNVLDVDSVAGQVIALSFNSPVFAFGVQNSADTSSTASTTVYADAMTGTIVLPVGTWTIMAWSAMQMKHSAGGTVRTATEIDGVAAVASTLQAADTAVNNTVFSTQSATGVAGNRSVNIKAQFRASAAGTATGDHPFFVAFAWRTS